MTKALVISASRRNVKLITASGVSLAMRIPPKLKSVVAGDLLELDDQSNQITKIVDRKNCFLRSYRERTKEIAANLDMLFIIAAAGPAGIIQFIDRVIACCEDANIAYTLVINKIDLKNDALKEAEETYSKLGIKILHTSTKIENGTKELEVVLQNNDLKTVAFAGVSGVGKSSILNVLVPEAKRRTQVINERNGLGKQTTSQAVGYLYKRNSKEDVLLIDLPGIQSFGISQIKIRNLANCFPEFREPLLHCEYDDCMHRAEPNCGVKDALEAGTISPFRYESYLSMLSELEEASSY